MAKKIKKIGMNFFNFFKGSETIPTEFKDHYLMEDYKKVENEDYFINL